ncbi:MAG TPA: hypothetical protein VFS49_09760, partial [Croceibacterium sp.]|nr:hypothetical protein [Croceibacterium sp.]
HRIIGTLGEDRRAVTIAFDVPLARVGGRDIALAPGDVAYSPTDIFIRATALEAILPVRFAIDAEALSIDIAALEKLPIQARWERLGRLRGLEGSTREEEPSQRIATPYRLFSPPTFDAILETGRDTRQGLDARRRYDIRFAGDLLYTNMQGYVGADDAGEPSTVRLLFERRSAAGDLPLGATRISAGDIYTPALPIGPRSLNGRGFSLTTAPLDSASLLNTIDLRGELPIGYDVELYVNDILRSGQRTPVEGRYEFLNVPLVSGINVIRIVTYGPRGDRSETVRVVNAGGGIVPAGKAVFTLGAAEPERVLFELNPRPGLEELLGETGPLRVVGGVAYGLTDMVTLLGGAALYSSARDIERDMATVGVRASVAGFAVQADVAADQRGGRAAAAGLAGRILGISTFLRHAEYRGGFIDENVLVETVRPPIRNTVFTADASLPFFGGGAVPVSASVVRDEYRDGGVAWTGTGRTSMSVAKTLVSTALDYRHETRPNADTTEELTGNLALSRLVNYDWQLRAGADFDLLPSARLRSIGATVDYALSERLSTRFGYGQSFGKDGEAAFQAGGVLRLPFADLSLTGDYATGSGDWSVTLQFSFGALFDPVRRSYTMTSPGVSSGANAAVHAFIDADGDGVFSDGDRPASNVRVEGGLDETVTDSAGHALIAGLGAGPSTQLRLDIADVEELYLVAPPATIEFEPRPGQVVTIPYPLQPAGEIYARVFLRSAAGETGLSGLRMQLVGEGQPPITAASEFDGSIVFAGIPPGRYRLEIDAQQAERLHMRLSEPISITVAAEDSLEVAAEVIFDDGASRATEPAPGPADGGLSDARREDPGGRAPGGSNVGPSGDADASSAVLTERPRTVGTDVGPVPSSPAPPQAGGDVHARAVVRRAEGETGLSALRLRFVGEREPTFTATTGLDGSLLVTGVPAGRYRVEIDPDQATRWRIRLGSPATLLVAAEARADVALDVLFESEAS